MESEELRKQYISPPVPAEGCPLVYPSVGQPWVGRRIDYILYRENSISKHCQTVCVSLCLSTFSSVISTFSYASVCVNVQVPAVKLHFVFVFIQEIEELTFITQLAGLTDHIPVGLRLNVIMDPVHDDV